MYSCMINAFEEFRFEENGSLSSQLAHLDKAPDKIQVYKEASKLYIQPSCFRKYLSFLPMGL